MSLIFAAVECHKEALSDCEEQLYGIAGHLDKGRRYGRTRPPAGRVSAMPQLLVARRQSSVAFGRGMIGRNHKNNIRSSRPKAEGPGHHLRSRHDAAYRISSAWRPGPKPPMIGKTGTARETGGGAGAGYPTGEGSIPRDGPAAIAPGDRRKGWQRRCCRHKVRAGVRHGADTGIRRDIRRRPEGERGSTSGHATI